MEVFKFICGIFMILGIVFIVTAILIKCTFEKKKNGCTCKTHAVIVNAQRVERSQWAGEPSFVSYFPIYEYTYGGKTYHKSAGIGYLKDMVHVGSHKIIYVNPDNPEIIMEDMNVPNFITCLFGILGVIFLIISILVIVIMISG